MGIPEWIAGEQTLLVGVDDRPEGGIKMYLGHRANGLYAVVTDADAVEKVKRAWEGGGCHILVPTPPADCIYADPA